MRTRPPEPRRNATRGSNEIGDQLGTQTDGHPRKCQHGDKKTNRMESEAEGTPVVHGLNSG